MTINIEITSNPPLAHLCTIHAESFPKAWKEADIGELFQVPGTYAFVADEGFGILRVMAGEAELLTIAVKPYCRKKGVGNSLMGAMRRFLKEQGSRMFFLEVRESNYEACSLYRKLGFMEIARRRGYYTNMDGTVEDALIMRYAI